MGYFYIYSLLRNGNIFYVGITDSLNRRLREHRQNMGSDIDINKIEEYIGEPEGAINIETKWINKFKSDGVILTNIGTPRKYGKNAHEIKEGGCLNCGNDLIYVRGKKAKTFCNSTCRSGYWHKQKTKEKEYAKKLQSDIEKIKKSIFDKGPIPPKNIYEDKNGDQLVTSRKDTPEGYVEVKKTIASQKNNPHPVKTIAGDKKQMPKGLSIQEQIDWKINNL